ncbi:MAG: enoyl-CoA hydratase/isomerase family protein [Myxococcales bacterium]|nr:enoyl-CoA hydratase/isomerase family protein [Myxococcales bacterium]
MKELILSAPGKNAINSELMRQVLAELRDADGDALLVTGAGDAFSAGLNLKEVLSMDARAMRTFLALLEEVTVALWEYPGPTVALVNGHAIAGGCILAMTCDHRVVTDGPKLRVGLNEVALGLRFPPRVMKLVKARVPSRSLERVILGAELFDPMGAQLHGLVDEVAIDASQVAGERLAALALHPRDAYARAKHMLRAGVLSLTAEETAQFETEDLPVWTSDAVRARIRAVLER